ncbi:MAG: GNAT family N-acetyltransferase [Moraxellaceae bacterium]|nr:GNAT family N-acetyltransferase [Moraxellaceae bacterium]
MPNQTNTLGQAVGALVPSWSPPPFPPYDAMEGRLCVIEPLVPDRDAAALYEANSLDKEGKMWTYLPYGPFASFELYRSWLRVSVLTSDPQFYTIIDKNTQKAVGVVAYLRIDPKNGSIEVGHLMFSPKMQKTSLATEAMYLMMKRAFELGYRRYEWRCNALNQASRKAAQRFGFSFEGVLRQATVSKGRNRDTAWYAAIDEEWPVLKAAFEQWLSPSNFDEHGQQKVPLSSLTEAIVKNWG